MNKETLKSIRQSLDLSQAEFGSLLGCTRQQVCNWECGTRSITKQTELAIECILYRNNRLDLINDLANRL